MSELTVQDSPTDQEILQAFLSNPKQGLKGVSKMTGASVSLVSKVLKTFGVVSDRRALSNQDGADVGGSLDNLTDAGWAFISGVFFAQKRGVYISGSTVRISMTISDPLRVSALGKLIGVGEVNTLSVNSGDGYQFIYRMARKDQVRRFLTEMQARLPIRHPYVEQGLAVLNESKKDV